MIYPGARPRVVAQAKYKKHRNRMHPDFIKPLAKALGESTDKASLKQTAAFLEEESIVTHQGRKYRCTVVRLYAPVVES